MATRVRDVMTVDPVCLETTATAREGADCMRREDIGDVLVVDGPTLRGIVTDRDIVTRVVAEGQDPGAVSLGDICSADLEAVSPDDKVREVIERMRSAAVRRVPVVDNGTPIGILSMGDLALLYDDESVLADISAAPPDR